MTSPQFFLTFWPVPPPCYHFFTIMQCQFFSRFLNSIPLFCALKEDDFVYGWPQSSPPCQRNAINVNWWTTSQIISDTPIKCRNDNDWAFWNSFSFFYFFSSQFQIRHPWTKEACQRPFGRYLNPTSMEPTAAGAAAEVAITGATHGRKYTRINCSNRQPCSIN